MQNIMRIAVVFSSSHDGWRQMNPVRACMKYQMCVKCVTGNITGNIKNIRWCSNPVFIITCSCCYANNQYKKLSFLQFLSVSYHLRKCHAAEEKLASASGRVIIPIIMYYQRNMLNSGGSMRADFSEALRAEAPPFPWKWMRSKFPWGPKGRSTVISLTVDAQ